MALFDIMPYDSPNGNHTRVRHGTIESTGAFFKGDIVRPTAAGELEQAADEPALRTALGVGAIGIAMAGTAGVSSFFSALGTQASANADGSTIPYVPFNSGDSYVTRNFTEADDTTFDGVPDSTTINDLACLRTDGTSWGICTNTGADNRNFRVTDVLDADGVSVAKSGGTGVSVVFMLEAN